MALTDVLTNGLFPMDLTYLEEYLLEIWRTTVALFLDRAFESDLVKKYLKR